VELWNLSKKGNHAKQPNHNTGPPLGKKKSGDYVAHLFYYFLLQCFSFFWEACDPLYRTRPPSLQVFKVLFEARKLLEGSGMFKA
jgi:hypothetical protein